VPVTGRVRILAFGDFGYGTRAQGKVAHAMSEVHQREPFHFGITLGDNFYPNGLNSATHPRWRTQWEEMYAGLGIRVYATLGNHDHRDPASPAAQQARSRLSRSWCLPRPYYTFTAGPVQLFALDTVPIEEKRGTAREQLAWLEGALAASRAPWKVVYGHHPVYTNGSHGGAVGVLPPLRDALLPILKKHRVNLYLAGHDHDLQELAPDGGVHFLISGGGGRDVRPLKSKRCREWAESRFGFLGLEADEKALTATFYGDVGQQVHEVRLRKGETVADCRR
jgi:tartrate-resistant acid phosphatase type 5